MSSWPTDELQKIAETDDLHISPSHEDGKTYGTPTWIWSVVVDSDLYVRAYNGKTSRWYRAALRQKPAHFGSRNDEGSLLRARVSSGTRRGTFFVQGISVPERTFRTRCEENSESRIPEDPDTIVSWDW